MMDRKQQTDKCLTYHMIEGPANWRQESPKLDKDIEDTIEGVMDGKLSLDQFVDRCNRYTTELSVLHKAGIIGHSTRQNYELILNLVFVQLQEREDYK